MDRRSHEEQKTKRVRVKEGINVSALVSTSAHWYLRTLQDSLNSTPMQDSIDYTHFRNLT